MIALDIDGVVADSADVLRTIIRYSYGIDIDDHIVSYKIPQIYPYLDIGPLFEDCMINFGHAVKPYPDAKEACNLLYKRIDYPIIFITARRESLKEITKEWIVNNLSLPKDGFSVIFKPSADKQIYIKNSGISHFIEDRFRTANQIAEIDTIKKSYLINRQWNLNREVNKKVVRKNSLMDCILDYLLLER